MDAMLDLFEMDDIDPIDIFEDITKPSRFSTPNTQEDEHTQLRRESASSTLKEESLIPGFATSSNSSMLKTTNKSENEMLVSTPRIEVRIAETSSAFSILFLF